MRQRASPVSHVIFGIFVPLFALALMLAACGPTPYEQGYSQGRKEGRESIVADERAKGYEEGFKAARPGGVGGSSVLKRTAVGVITTGAIVALWLIMAFIGFGLMSSRDDFREIFLRITVGSGGWLLSLWASSKITTLDQLFFLLIVGPPQGIDSLFVLTGSAFASFALVFSVSQWARFAHKSGALWAERSLVLLLGIQSYFITTILAEQVPILTMVEEYLAYDVLFGVLFGVMTATVLILARAIKSGEYLWLTRE